MTPPPFAFLQGVGPVLLLEHKGRLEGLDVFRDVAYRIDQRAPLLHAINILPAAAVYPFVEMVESTAGLRVANPLGLVGARGVRFEALPEGVLSGFPIARPQIERHRREVPSESVITLSMAFALATVQTDIGRAEKAFACYGERYLSAGTTPTGPQILDCFVQAGTGLEPTKTGILLGLKGYGAVVESAMLIGLRDRALRRHLASEATMPRGLSLAKLSFTLALLGHDCICLDARLLGRIFTKTERGAFERATRKSESGAYAGRLRPAAVDVYEEAEDAFLAGNPYYKPDDPLGRARAQWMSWESVGGEGATHATWLDVIGRA